MVALRRIVLVLLAVTVPFLLTYLVRLGSQYLLTATSRTIDPMLMQIATVTELLAFFFVAVLEVRSRW